MTDNACICSDCWRKLPRVPIPICPRCGEPMRGAVARVEQCTKCGGGKVAYNFARSACLNREPLRSLILKYKYQGKVCLKDVFIPLLAEAWELSDYCFEGEDWLVVPVPLHGKKLWKRGYNQAEELAAGLAKLKGLTVIDALERRKDKVSQASLSKLDRIRHVKGLYRVKEEIIRDGRIAGKAVLLIDDIITTGSTINVCAQALRRMGKARKVGVLSLGRTYNERNI